MVSAWCQNVPQVLHTSQEGRTGALTRAAAFPRPERNRATLSDVVEPGDRLGEAVGAPPLAGGVLLRARVLRKFHSLKATKPRPSCRRF